MSALARLSTHGLRLLVIACLLIWSIAVVGSLRLLEHPFSGFRFEPTLTISAVNDPSWTGSRAQLQQFDRLLKVDGHELRTDRDLFDYVQGRPVGSRLHYELAREGKVVQLDVPTQAFGLKDWFKSFLPMFLVGLLHLVVGTIAFALKPASVTARVHLLMNAAICLFCSLAGDYDAGHGLARIYLVAVPLLGSTFLHLGLVFPDSPLWLRRRSWLHAAPYVPVLLIAPVWLAIFRPVGFLANPEGFELHMHLQDLSTLWLMLGLLGLIVSILVRLFRSKRPLIRQQAKVAVFGAALAYLPGTILWIIPYLAHLNALDNSGLLVNLSYACFVFFPLSVAYAIVRHQMFDIDLVIKRTVVYATVVAALAGVYFLVIAGVRSALDVLFHASGSEAGNVVATAVVALAFVPVRYRVQALIDRLFFRGGYDFRAVVSAFGRFAKEQPELDGVVEQFVALVDEALHPRHLSLMVREPRSRSLQVYREAGLEVFPATFALATDAPELAELLKSRNPVRQGRGGTQPLGSFQAMGILHCIPLEIKGELLGLINVGPKLSELDYSTEDQQLLNNMASQLASVIRIHEMTKAEVSRARLDAELEVARNIQASLLPAQVKAPNGLDVVGSSTSALEFGGDYYDLVTLADGQLRVVVGDVAGKGVQAAMVMAMAKSCFYNQVRHEADLPAVMKALNSMIIETIDDKKHRKTTLIYAAIDPTSRMLQYACAGHQPPHYFNALTGRVEDLPIPGSFPFGASKLAKYEAQDVALHSGDVLVFYTDGLTEAQTPAGRMFFQIDEGPEGQDIVHDQLQAVLEAHHSESATEIHGALLAAVAAWVEDGPQGDDITVVVVKVA